MCVTSGSQASPQHCLGCMDEACVLLGQLAHTNINSIVDQFRAPAFETSNLGLIFETIVTYYNMWIRSHWNTPSKLSFRCSGRQLSFPLRGP